MKIVKINSYDGVLVHSKKYKEAIFDNGTKVFAVLNGRRRTRVCICYEHGEMLLESKKILTDKEFSQYIENFKDFVEEHLAHKEVIPQEPNMIYILGEKYFYKYLDKDVYSKLPDDMIFYDERLKIDTKNHILYSPLLAHQNQNLDSRDYIVKESSLKIKNIIWSIVVQGEIRKKLLEFSQNVEAQARKMNMSFVELVGVSVKNLKGKWGLCSRKTSSRTGKVTATITLNISLAKYPLDCLYGTLYHELCHLVCTNHDENFYKLLVACYPQYLQSDKILVYGNKDLLDD